MSRGFVFLTTLFLYLSSSPLMAQDSPSETRIYKSVAGPINLDLLGALISKYNEPELVVVNIRRSMGIDAAMTIGTPRRLYRLTIAAKSYGWGKASCELVVNRKTKFVYVGECYSYALFPYFPNRVLSFEQLGLPIE